MLSTAAIIVAASYNPAFADEPEKTIEVTDFSSGQIGRHVPLGWETLDFSKIPEKTIYQVVGDEQFGAVIHARSKAAAGGLVKPVIAKADEFPTLRWSWKIDRIINGSAVGSKKGDDFPARILVSFKTHENGPASAFDNVICYVWADHDPVGTFMKNPFHDHIMTIVVANNDNETGKWLEMSRNVAADYFAAFGVHPVWISAVSLMTDSDNTGTETRAWYGPIMLVGNNVDAR